MLALVLFGFLSAMALLPFVLMGVQSFGCCCAAVKCGIVDGILIGTYNFSDLNAKPDGTDYTQYTFVGTLTGHFVVAYAGTGSYQATESGTTKWFSVWDYWIGMLESGATLPGFDGVYTNRAVPDGGHVQVSPWAGGPTSGPPNPGGYNVDPFGTGATGLGGEQDWVSLLASSGGAYPVDASADSATAQSRCLAMEFAANGTQVWFLYSRSSAYTLVNGTPTPSFRIYRIKPNFTIIGLNLVYGGAFDPHMHLFAFVVTDEHTFVFWVDVVAVGHETTSLVNPSKLVANENWINHFSWPNVSPGTFAMPTTAEVKIQDSFTGEVAADFTGTLTPVMVNNGWSENSRIGPGHYSLDFSFANNGTADVPNATVALSAPGMTVVSYTFGTAFNCASLLPPPWRGGSSVNTTDLTAELQFTNVNNTVTATITYGGQTFTVPFTVNGMT